MDGGRIKEVQKKKKKQAENKEIAGDTEVRVAQKEKTERKQLFWVGQEASASCVYLTFDLRATPISAQPLSVASSSSLSLSLIHTYTHTHTAAAQGMAAEGGLLQNYSA